MLDTWPFVKTDICFKCSGNGYSLYKSFGSIDNDSDLWPARPATHGNVMRSPLLCQCSMIDFCQLTFCKIPPYVWSQAPRVSTPLSELSRVSCQPPGSDHWLWVGGQTERQRVGRHPGATFLNIHRDSRAYGTHSAWTCWGNYVDNQLTLNCNTEHVLL